MSGKKTKTLILYPLAMLFFIDESGHDHGTAPYEVLAAVAIAERDLWNLIQAIRTAEIEFFGVHLSNVGIEFKGKKLLKNKTFRRARQAPEIDPSRRRDLAREFLMKGWREAQGNVPEARSRDEFTAYGQAARAFVQRILGICTRYHAKTFAALVKTSAPRAADPNLLRRDYAFLFQRFYYYLEDCSATEMGLVVFDELEKAQSRILIEQMARYFWRQRMDINAVQELFPNRSLSTAI